MEGKRPGGLTALAVLNFIGSALNLVGVLAQIFLIGLIMGVASEAIASSGDEEAQRIIELWKKVGVGPVAFLAVLTFVAALLLLVSGIGYLKQKRFLGRTLGNAYGVIGVAGTLAAAIITPLEAGGGFNVSSIINLVYPLLTLLLLNTTFKHDFGD